MRSVTRSDPRFEALMAYYDVDRAQAYIESLGFTDVLNRQFRVRADAFPDDDSFFDPGTREFRRHGIRNLPVPLFRVKLSRALGPGK